MHFSEPRLVRLADLGAEGAAAAAAAISKLGLREDLVIAAGSGEVDWLPQIALAGRANAWKILGYILIEAMPAGVHPDWPDAPVVVVTADEARKKAASLRDWQSLPATGDRDSDAAAAISWIDSGS